MSRASQCNTCVLALFALGILGLPPLARAQSGKPTPGNPPGTLIASGIDSQGQLFLVSYRTIFIQPATGFPGGPRSNDRYEKKISLQGVKIQQMKGGEVTLEKAREILGGKEKPVLVTGYGKPCPSFYKTLFRDETLVFIFPNEPPAWEHIQAPDLPVGP